ncbi:O-acetylhomoserine aminocarboxypropyltransferase [Pseudoclavibacter endophyticus]|uniref:homocysteine desulfhydrase n=1 Tax=Pseudoclavibacter endophyticus TaxID=1778590 RepID=A0A6H9WQ65_9MICO|nr:aminotransferase class V-fold PLP-dependent enzyme [Pseudoclavibacter endophyticus]KAB1650278.1 O-acetylhomoserine aminocarboxypropyltransferase/cysteine synthase [Pseudoclavibacter endophyticus]GGA55558.1 O-acetylhomoserine aminocarboxypropyltransferase [Pseudoclavibacter endophyticus]
MTPSPTGRGPAEPTYDFHGFGFETRQVHAGEVPERNYGARIPPIYLSNAFRFDSFDQAAARFDTSEDGQLYSRDLNPTNMVAERRIAALEGGTEAVLVSSGQGAIAATMLALCKAGDHFVTTASIYSGTRILFQNAMADAGVAFTDVWDWTDEAAWAAAITPRTRAIFTESIPNPKNDVIDIAAIARVARAHSLPLVVDNTIATPYLSRPLEHGADIVVHSSTKFLGGHGTAISGVIVDGGRFDWGAVADRYPRLALPPAPGKRSPLEQYGDRAFGMYARHTSVNEFGFAVSPMNGFLLQQGIETLSLRMEQHLANSIAIATWLEGQPEVESVDYAALASSPHRQIADRCYGGRPGSVFAFTVHGGKDAARAVFDRVELWSRMTNIGDVRSMILHPATTTHAGFTQETRDRLGIGDGLLRLSVGIETVDDLIADLRRGLDAVAADAEG